MAIDIASALKAYGQAPKPGASTEAATGGSFGDLLSSSLDDALKSTRAGEQAMAMGAAGKGEMVDVVTAVANAETSMETVIALRDRVISAYQDIMRMPI